MNTYQEAIEHAKREGVYLSPEELRQALATKPKGLIDNWLHIMPNFLLAITTFGEAIIAISNTVIVSVFLPLVLVLLLVVEYSRIEHGISLFEVDHALATLASISLVLANLVVELLIHYQEHKAHYTAPTHHAFSLRLWLQSAFYWLGISKNFTPRLLSPAHRYIQLQKLISFTILSLALLGSMKAVIANTEGYWFIALGAVLTQSTLLEFLTWLGGLLFAFSAVASAQSLTSYIAQRTVEVIAEAKARQDATKLEAVMQLISTKEAHTPAPTQAPRKVFNGLAKAVNQDANIAPRSPEELRVIAQLPRVRRVKSKVCIECNNPLPEGATARAKYCSKACKSKALRSAKSVSVD